MMIMNIDNNFNHGIYSCIRYNTNDNIEVNYHKDCIVIIDIYNGNESGNDNNNDYKDYHNHHNKKSSQYI